MSIQKPIRKKQVLLVEDSPITQDILELALGNNGHELIITDRANFALKALEDQEFDIALIDFNLPDCTGLELLERYFRDTRSKFRPKLVALTGDANEVEYTANAPEHFDLIVAKPFVMSDLVAIVEAEDAVARPMHQITTLSAEKMKPPDQVFSIGENFHVIYFPYDFYASYKNAVSQSIALNGPVDAVILDQVPNREQTKFLSSIKGLALAAFVDRTGEQELQSDFVFGGSEGAEGRLANALQARKRRRGEIHESFYSSRDIALNLLISLSLKDCDLCPRIHLGNRFGYAYNHILPPQKILELANAHTLNGFLQSRQIGGILRCPKCTSARIYPQRFDTDLSEDNAALICTDCLDKFGTSQVKRETMPQYCLTKKARAFLKEGCHVTTE